MRSKLFVPGARPELFAKALAGEADALSFDLEDSVPEPGKVAAREAVAAFVRTPEALASGKLLIVRTNAQGSVHFERDLAALAGAPVDIVNLPKAESADAVRDAASRLRALWPEGAVPGLLANIETPRGLHEAAAIAGADPAVVGLQLGLGDLFEPFGIDRAKPENLHAAMFALRMAAAEADVFAYDGAYAAIGDEAGFRAEAALSRSLGFLGKSCIHPRQVAWANDVFRAGEAEVAHARKVVEAARDAHAQGRGAFTVDGHMVDAPYLKRAEATLRATRSWRRRDARHI